MKIEKRLLNDELKKLLCKRILELCERKGLTILKLTENSSISKEKLIKIERNQILPKLYEINDICIELGITLYHFFDCKEFNDLLKK